jgi:hypothetical protein
MVPTTGAQTDLTSLHYGYRGGLLLIESKDDAKKRGIKSPDRADSLMLTFAEPVAPSIYSRPARRRGSWRMPEGDLHEPNLRAHRPAADRRRRRAFVAQYRKGDVVCSLQWAGDHDGAGHVPVPQRGNVRAGVFVLCLSSLHKYLENTGYASKASEGRLARHRPAARAGSALALGVRDICGVIEDSRAGPGVDAADAAPAARR